MIYFLKCRIYSETWLSFWQLIVGNFLLFVTLSFYSWQVAAGAGRIFFFFLLSSLFSLISCVLGLSFMYSRLHNAPYSSFVIDPVRPHLKNAQYKTFNGVLLFFFYYGSFPRSTIYYLWCCWNDTCMPRVKRREITRRTNLLPARDFVIFL